jgi:hypothetical protein
MVGWPSSSAENIATGKGHCSLFLQVTANNKRIAHGTIGITSEMLKAKFGVCSNRRGAAVNEGAALRIITAIRIDECILQ